MSPRAPTSPVWRFPAPPDAGPDGAAEDAVAEEAPLRVRVGGHDLGILMRTPGDDEALAVGFALGEGVLADPAGIDRVRLCPASAREGAAAEVELLDPAGFDPTRSLRTGLVTSGCGVCGRELLDAVLARRPAAPEPPGFPLEAAALAALPEALAGAQELFPATGGCHGAALFEADGTLVAAAEDVGRHNAVDKVLGRVALAGRWPAPPVLVVSSRGSYDILQKAVVAGVVLVGLVSAPSALAVRMAVAAGLTLVRFVRGGGLAVYAGRGRVRFPGPPPCS